MGLLDLQHGDIQIICSSRELLGAHGVTGLALTDSHLLAAVQNSSMGPFLAIFDRQAFQFIDRHVFELARDVHSIVVDGNDVVVASSGTDEVVRVRLEGSRVISEAVVWRPDSSAPRGDYHHLNALCHANGDLLVSGFGRKPGKLWSSAHDGFIFNITTNQVVVCNIDQPHSIVALGETLAYCESRRMRIRTVNDSRQVTLPGYTRGLCRTGDTLCVALSQGRKSSKSTGIIENPSDAVEVAEDSATLPLQGTCSVVCASVATFEPLWTIDLSLYASEIYDLIPVPRFDDGRPCVHPGPANIAGKQ